jgi:hypothetical protein
VAEQKPWIATSGILEYDVNQTQGLFVAGPSVGVDPETVLVMPFLPPTFLSLSSSSWRNFGLKNSTFAPSEPATPEGFTVLSSSSEGGDALTPRFLRRYSAKSWKGLLCGPAALAAAAACCVAVATAEVNLLST